MYGPRGAMLGGYLDGYEGSSKRQRMTEPNPYFAVPGSQLYGYGGGSHLPSGFPVVRLRGLPFNCSDIEIIKFFNGLEIIDVLLVNKRGRFSGEAFVVFATQMQVEYALRKDKHDMGRRYVEVFRCKKKEYYDAVADEVKYGGKYDNAPESPRPRSKKSVEKIDLEFTEVLRLRGLPFSVKKSDIVEFFDDFKVASDNVQIACRHDGKTTGEAFVEFASADVAKRAMCKDRKTIGLRYVELFPSTRDEYRRAVSRSRQ